jgi:pyrrolidone-carboxylate peptidase
MTFASVKLWLKEKWYYLASVLAVVGLALFAALRKKTDPSAINTAPAVALQQKLADARVQAALEIGRAQGREEEVKHQVAQINNMPTATQDDKKKQLQALADLVNNTRRKR